MSTAERLALALEALAYAVHEGRLVADSTASEGYITSVVEAAERELAAYRSTPADGGGQGVTPLSDDDALALARKHLDKGLSWAPHITRCTDLEVKALIRAVEQWHRIGTPASTGGEDRG